MALVVILNDGETFSDIEGCVVLDVPDDLVGDEVDAYVAENYDQGAQITPANR